ncbi:peptidase associated/transthyretin-like domain-containing protein [Hymenobacter amundsenii]|uniref:hypothetical protein n=1 Tax=Hymenobacter amundsenii TaxID=2006685 RepID=UPI000F8389DC|nr:hypothetical protein [Hymenobacter amundsenii]
MNTSSASAQTATAPLPATTPAYELPGSQFPIVPDEATAAAVLTGAVMDEQGRPFPGAVLMIWKTKLGTETDASGRYRLPVPSHYLSRRGRVKILAGQIGFLRQNLRLDARLVEQPVIRLVPDVRPLH